jgi:hypothetical protein
MSEGDVKIDLDDAARLGLQTTVIALSDTKLLLGYHYGEWTFGPPAIEAGIAACSMAQEEFGHTRLFNRILKREFDIEIDPLNDTRPPEVFASIAFLDRAFKSWADLVAANVVVDQALSLRSGFITPMPRGGCGSWKSRAAHHARRCVRVCLVRYATRARFSDPRATTRRS